MLIYKGKLLHIINSSQEAAQLEKAKTRIMETQEHEPTNKQLAIALGTKLGSIDRILCRARESRDRLIRCYSKLVISIAAPYQGKGLSLQDLTQVGCCTFYLFWIVVFCSLFKRFVCFRRKGTLVFLKEQKDLNQIEDISYQLMLIGG